MSGGNSNLSSHGSRNGRFMTRQLHATPSQPPFASSSGYPEFPITQHPGTAIDDMRPIFSYENRVGEPFFPFRRVRVPTSTPSNVHVFELGYHWTRPYQTRPQISSSRNDAIVPADSSDESRLTQDEQKKALNELRKETYNPLLSTKTSPRSDYQARDWAILSRQTEVGKNSEHGQRCAICLEDFQIKEVVTLTPCNHMFHDDCIVPWVKSHGKCPVCRYAIVNPGHERREREAAMVVGNNPGRHRREGAVAAMASGHSPNHNYPIPTFVRGRPPPAYEISGYGLGPRNTLTFMPGNINDRLFERDMVSLLRAVESAFEWDVARPSLN